MLLLLDLVVAAGVALLQLGQLRGDPVGLVVAADVGEGLAGDDERGAGLVDEDVVHLVDDGVVERDRLHLAEVRVVALVAAAGRLHVVAQVVEAELAVGAVGDLAVVGLAAGGGVHVGLDEAGLDAEGAVDGQHPLAVAAGEVVVDGDDVDALGLQRVEVGGQRGDEGLAFAGDHLGDVAAVQHDAAEDLHVEVAHVLGALGGLAAGGERLGEDVVEGGALGELLAELRRDVLELLGAERLHALFEGVDLRQEAAGHDDVLGAGLGGAEVAELLDVALVAGAEEAQEEAADGLGEGGDAVGELLPEADVHFGIDAHRHGLHRARAPRPRPRSVGASGAARKGPVELCLSV